MKAIMVSFSNDLIPCKEVAKADSVEGQTKVFGKLFIYFFYGHTKFFSLYLLIYFPSFFLDNYKKNLT